MQRCFRRGLLLMVTVCTRLVRTGAALWLDMIVFVHILLELIHYPTCYTESTMKLSVGQQLDTIADRVTAIIASVHTWL
eukprot:COSAG02_NODE_19922_length_858_cov_0.996047_2_plen_79_part_00